MFEIRMSIVMKDEGIQKIFRYQGSYDRQVFL